MLLDEAGGFKALAMGLFRQQVDRFLDRRVQIEIDDFKVEFPA